MILQLYLLEVPVGPLGPWGPNFVSASEQTELQGQFKNSAERNSSLNSCKGAQLRALLPRNLQFDTALCPCSPRPRE